MVLAACGGEVVGRTSERGDSSASSTGGASNEGPGSFGASGATPSNISTGGVVGSSAGVAGSTDADASSPTVGQCVDEQPSPALSPWDPWDPWNPSVPDDIRLWEMRAALVGTWSGIVTTPWAPPYAVSVEFRPEGTYSARCTYHSNECCVAFNYGSDFDSPLKTWTLDAIGPDGTATGALNVAFCSAPDACYAPSWQGLLRAVNHDANGDRIRFEFWRDDGYGPVAFDLQLAL